MAAKLILTYVDASVLINAAVGKDRTRQLRAQGVLSDPRREFAASTYLILEVLPGAVYKKRMRERSYYEQFFKRVVVWIDETLIKPRDWFDKAFNLASKYGLGAVDALHLVAAEAIGAEFISAERTTKPIYRAYTKISTIY